MGALDGEVSKGEGKVGLVVEWVEVGGVFSQFMSVIR